MDENPSFLYKFTDLFTNKIFAWLFKGSWIKKAYEYPTLIPYPVISAGDIKLAIAADWASGTPQAEYVGRCIKDKNTDYTVHLGDTYYSGTKKEMEYSFGIGGNDMGIWPRGKMGSFALCGNHEMFSSGIEYYRMITGEGRGWGVTGATQEAPVFCIKTPHWCILGLDTGYDSLRRGILPIRSKPNNTDLTFPESVVQWLLNVVCLPTEQRGIIIFTHHQYITAFNGEEEFHDPARILKTLLPDNKEVLWFWGHEHRFSVYNKFQLDNQHIPAYGRCLGNGGMPVEHTPDRSPNLAAVKTRNALAYDIRTAETFATNGETLNVGYNGYAILDIKDENLTTTYYSTYLTTSGITTDEILYTENWTTDQSGVLSLTHSTDTGKLTFF